MQFLLLGLNLAFSFFNTSLLAFLLYIFFYIVKKATKLAFLQSKKDDTL